MSNKAFEYVEREMERARSQRDLLVKLINYLASIPSPDYYKPDDYMAGLVAKTWQQKNEIMAPGSGDNSTIG